MNKKLISLIAVGVLAASLLAGCGAQETKAPAPQQAAPAGQAAPQDPYQKAKEWSLARVKDQLTGIDKMEGDIKAGNWEGLKKSWLDAQLNYEKGEAIYAAISSELDEVIDVSDQTGWTGAERLIYGKNPAEQKDKLLALTDQLRKDVLRLQAEVEKTPFNKELIFQGLTGVLKELAGFVQEVYDGSSVSGTRITDAQNVFEGIGLFYDAVAPEVKAKDEALDKQIRDQVAKVKEVLGKEKPQVEAVDAETGQLFKLFVQAGTKLGVKME